jgi:hypothetical protein
VIDEIVIDWTSPLDANAVLEPVKRREALTIEVTEPMLVAELEHLVEGTGGSSEAEEIIRLGLEEMERLDLTTVTLILVLALAGCVGSSLVMEKGQGVWSFRFNPQAARVDHPASTAQTNTAQPARNASPPSGVIAPSQRVSVSTNT